MGTVGTTRRNSMTRHIESRGRTTTLNGQTIKALWQNANVDSIQRFLQEEEWGLDSMELRLPYYATAAPFLLKNGVEVVRSGLSWRGVVRNVTVEDSDDVVISCSALVTLVPD